MTDRRPKGRSVLRALEAARFGDGRTLNLRASLPTPQDAVARAEPWLRRMQAEQGGEVLIITGRGNQSIGGVSVVRTAIVRLLGQLRRVGVITAVSENTPGSFIVTLAPMRALLEAPRRHRGHSDPAPAALELHGLDADARDLLRRLAECSLERLGIRDTEAFIADEMRRQFSLLAARLPAGAQRDEQLRATLARALEEYEEG